jgi:hypothetical protein
MTRIDIEAVVFQPTAPKYIQRQIDKLLREDKAFFRSNPLRSIRVRRYVLGEFWPDAPKPPPGYDLWTVSIRPATLEKGALHPRIPIPGPKGVLPTEELLLSLEQQFAGYRHD